MEMLRHMHWQRSSWPTMHNSLKRERSRSTPSHVNPNLSNTKDQLRGSRDLQQLANLALCEGRQYTPVEGNRHFIGGHRAKQDRVDDLLQRWNARLALAQ